MPRRFLDLTGFVLAGGKSRRMGRPKQELVIGGETLLDRQLRLLGAVCGQVGVIGRPKPRCEERCFFYEDEWPGLGPLGGIFTGLARTRTEYNLFVGCDMPFLTPSLLRYIVARAMNRRALVTAPESPDKRVQPLCAVYRRDAKRIIRMSLTQGANKTSGFYARIERLAIRWPELSRADFSPNVFTNINTQADYAAARLALEART